MNDSEKILDINHEISETRKALQATIKNISYITAFRLAYIFESRKFVTEHTMNVTIQMGW